VPAIFIAIEKGCTSDSSELDVCIRETMDILVSLCIENMDVVEVSNKFKPLHYAVKNGLSWSAGLDTLIRFDELALTVPDEEEGLLPFMLAAAGPKTCDMTTICKLTQLTVSIDGSVSREVNNRWV